MSLNIVPQDFNFLPETVNKDGMVNISLLANAYFSTTGKRKDTHSWLVTKEATESIAYLELATGVTRSDIVIVENGVGTWIHPSLVNELVEWLKRNPNKKPDYLYVIGDKSRSVCKIGITGKPDIRLRTIQTSYPWDLDFWHCIKVKNANSVEKMIHGKLADFKLNGEWFDSRGIKLINWDDLK